MSLKDQQLLEEAYGLVLERTRPELYVSVLDQLEPYSKDPNYFVSFTTIEKIGINPVNNFSTPIGVYAYNLQKLWLDWIHGDDFFGNDRPYVNLIKLNTDKICRIRSYVLTSIDFNKLKNIYESLKSEKNFENFVEERKKVVSEQTNLYSNSSDGALLWDLTNNIARMMTGSIGKNFTVKWNKLFRDLGYDVIIDDTSVIHLLQSAQAVFFVPDSYKLIKRLLNKDYGKNFNPVNYWGSTKQPYWRPGANPTVDLVLFYKGKVLLIKRNNKSSVEANKWAIPGGFIDTNTKKGELFEYDRETPKQAAIREVMEETQLYLANIKNIGSRLKEIGIYEGNKRDPRDNKEAWSKSHVFTLTLTDEDEVNVDKVKGSDDAAEASWFDLNNLPLPLAFDHEKIIKDTLNK
jgi:8-oxo-dGTP diphosphatase